MMLRHLGEFAPAATIEGALLATLEQGKTTRDIAGDAGGRAQHHGVHRGGRRQLRSDAKGLAAARLQAASSTRGLRGARLRARARPPGDRRRRVRRVGPRRRSSSARASSGSSTARRFRLKGISNRGTVVYPPTGAMTDCVDQWFCRFTLAANGGRRGTGRRGRRSRPARRRRASLDAPGEAPGVPRRGGVHEGPGRRLKPLPARFAS